MRAVWTVCRLAILVGLYSGSQAFADTAQSAPVKSRAGNLISSLGSERATSGSGSKIVTFAGKTHVVWQDSTTAGYYNLVRTYDHDKKTWSSPVTLNKGRDNHARPIIVVDGEGFLHVLMSGHNSPVTYRRSVRANDSSAWTKPEKAGSGTYPVALCGKDGTLYLTLRSAQGWNGTDLYEKAPGKKWRLISKLIVRDPKLPGYAGFANTLAWGPDGKTIHMVSDFYESKSIWKDRGVHQAVCYMKSTDAGNTWTRANGSPVKLPARPEDMDILARDIGKRHEPMPPAVLLSQGSLVVDKDGAPHILYVSHLTKPGQIFHATVDDNGKWRQNEVRSLLRKYATFRPVGCRGAMTIDQGDTIHVLLEIVSLKSGWVSGKPTRKRQSDTASDKRLVWLASDDGGRTFKHRPALDAGLSFHQANVERPSGFNTIPAGKTPPFIYFDGNPKKKGRGHVIQNNVFVVWPRG